jgi:hypothetical protein
VTQIKIKLNNPISSVNELAKLLSQINWVDTFVLTSPGNIIFLLKGETFFPIRVCPEKAEINSVLKLLLKTKSFKHIEVNKEIQTLSDGFFFLSSERLVASVKISLSKVARFFQVSFSKPRGVIKSPTAKRVFEDSHGRCMFTGCGELLRKDFTTGNSGNFAYLAHIVAASKDGPRGNEFESPRLANSPDNIMYLCDKHHRLIDKVALAEYKTHTLRQMRQEFLFNINKLLNQLKFEAIHTFTALWPIGKTLPSPPTAKTIAKSLEVFQKKENGNIRPINTTHDCRSSDPNWWKNNVPEAIEYVVNELKNGTNGFSKSLALYSIGPMPVLIALGAKLGNKNNVKIIPCSRQFGWGWSHKFQSNSFSIEGMEELSQEEEQVNLKFYLTDSPTEDVQATQSSVFPTIKIKPEFQDNDCISNPAISDELLLKMHALFTKLKRDFKTKVIHLFPCAPNVACIQLGRAIEHNHSDFVIYDFQNEEGNKKFVARLKISMVQDKAEISGA